MDQKTRNRIKAARAARKVPTVILLKKKRECDVKALQIVERMTEEKVEVDWMLQNLAFLNRSHLEDVAEERAIVKLCGYVLCDNPLTKVVNKRYQISTLRNKVYDIEKTKNYCTHNCYLATEYLMEQMLTSPLWLRDKEEIPDFKILQKFEERSISPPGVEIKLLPIDLPVDDDESLLREESLKKPNEKPVKSAFKRMKTSETVEVEKVNEGDESSTMEKPEDDGKKCKKVNKSVTFGENEIREFETMKIDSDSDSSEDSGSDDSWIEFREDDNMEIEKSELEIKVEGLGKIENVGEELTTNLKTEEKSRKSDRTLKKQNISFEKLVERVEKSFSEWITEDTSALLHGDLSSKQQILEKVNIQEKMNILCKKLNTVQIEEEREDRAAAIQSSDLKPAPHFSVLQEEAKNLELKIKAFYEGKTQFVKAEESVNERSDGDKKEENDDGFIPLTDSHDSRALRKRIFLSKLNRVLPDLLRTLAGPDQYKFGYTSDRSSIVKALVSTFELSAANIVFRSGEWTLVAFLIIKMLSLIDPQIKLLLSTKQASTYTSMILMTYKLSSNYLDDLILSLTTPRTKIDEM